MSGGGGGGGVESYLPIAAALAATVMTDGAAAPWLEESLAGTALEGAGATIMGGGIGALAGGATSALTGQNIGQGALMGGLGGAALGYGGLYSGAGEVAGGLSATAPLTGTNVAGTAAAPEFSTAVSEMAGAPSANSAFSPYAQDLLLNSQTTAANAGNYFDAIGQAGNAPIISDAANTTLANATGVSSGIGGAGSSGIFSGNLGTAAKLGLGATALGALMKQDNKKYGTPSAESQKYTGPLSDFHYSRENYTPYIATPPNPPYQPQYTNRVITAAEGGLMDPNSEPLDFASGGMYPQSQIQKPQYSQSTQMPMSAQAVAADYDPKTNPITGEPTAHMAAGGIAGTPNLGSYAAGGNPRLLKGPGDGMSDNIPATIGHKQPARLADGEFVVPADVVSHLGNGSTDAGAKQLYSMMDKVRRARTGSKKQGKEIKAEKYLPA